MPDNKQTTAAMNGHAPHLTHASLEETRSEEVQEIMGRMPPWIIRSGITLIGVLFLCAFAGAWFFRYPDSVPAEVLITAEGNSWEVRGFIAEEGVWRIKPGQKVLIRLTAYPYEEYGLLPATVASHAVVLPDSHFQVNIQLDQALKTNSGRQVPPQPMLKGTAEILTEDMSVLQRLFGKIIPG
ncbi:hypothetical protein [Chitinophaga solisilvae]|uniref:Uncharacterized protein n=1 Tax=Chitinophaga solisilvae TaxID=1233460 RepID=A0A3S1B2W7_9BACT|nr:hypothetical protein [Chitinophaga solisilvae]NSL90933.1 hypothetical protein [Chitinophaga solisilvae]